MGPNYLLAGGDGLVTKNKGNVVLVLYCIFVSLLSIVDSQIEIIYNAVFYLTTIKYGLKNLILQCVLDFLLTVLFSGSHN